MKHLIWSLLAFVCFGVALEVNAHPKWTEDLMDGKLRIDKTTDPYNPTITGLRISGATPVVSLLSTEHVAGSSARVDINVPDAVAATQQAWIRVTVEIDGSPVTGVLPLWVLTEDFTP